MTGNDVEAEVSMAEVYLTKVLEANATENPEGVEIPHQSEV
jgi:hypothetical protein